MKLFQYLNKHKELIPLFGVTTAGVSAAFCYITRLALKNPDCSWDRKNNQHPWLKIKVGQQVKLFTHADLSKVPDQRNFKPKELENL